MCCWFERSSDPYNSSLPDIKAAFVFLFDTEHDWLEHDSKKTREKYQAKTYQTTGVTFVVIPSTTWVLTKLIGSEVTAINAGYVPLPMSKHKLDFLLFQGLYHFRICFDSVANVFFAATPPSTQD